MKKHDSNLVLGLILILIGAGLLFRRMGFFDFGWEESYPIALLLLAAMAIVSVAKGDKSQAFWACFLLICGLFTFLKNYGLVDSFWSINLWSILLFAFGLSFFALYASKPRDWSLLIPGSILTTFGGVAILDDLHVDWFRISYFFDYWPLMLIAIGIAIIIGTLRRKPTT